MSKRSVPERVGPGKYLAGAALAAIIPWFLWCSENLAGLQIGGRIRHEEPMSIWFPIISMPIIVVVALLWWLRDDDIAKHGVIVEARVVQFGGQLKGWQDVIVAYELNGHRLITKKSIEAGLAGEMQIGDHLALIVDERHPSRTTLKECA